MGNKTILERVQDALEEIRPYLQADGGDISIVEITDDKIVKVQLMGACDGCPMSAQTMKNGVELVIKTKVPEIKEVIAI